MLEAMEAFVVGRDRAAAVAGLDAAVEAVAVELETQPETRLTGGDWGPREVLCHLVYWHEYYVSVVHALATGRQPALMVGAFPEFNRQAVRELGSVPVTDQVVRLRRAQRRLAVEFLRAEPHVSDQDQDRLEAAPPGRVRQSD